MVSEVHIFILWENSRFLEKKILDDIKVNFEILALYEIEWSKNKFSENLTRFYGENLPVNSKKEKLCGNGPFLLIVVGDNCPIYRMRKTSKGLKLVNVNMFDSKLMYRTWTGGGHLIHGTNTTQESNHDLTLLIGVNTNDFLNKNKCNISINQISFNRDLMGHDGWRDLEQLLYVMNATLDYVILRNYEHLPQEYTSELHGDLDFLVSSFEEAMYITNASRVFKSNKRAQTNIKVNELTLQCDFRFIGDGYYDTTWEKNILEQREFDPRGFYKCDAENYYYSLLYHALIHKPKLSKDYLETFRLLKPKIEVNNIKYLLDELTKYMNKMGYCYIEPTDFSVFYNSNYTHKSMSKKKFLYKSVNWFLRAIGCDKL